VERVGLASMGLFSTRFSGWPVEGRADDGLRRSEAVRWLVDEEYLDAMEIRLVRGRAFTPDDGFASEGVALVSETLARDLWPGSEAVGRYVRLAAEGMPGMEPEEPGAWLRVVGVVADVRREVTDARAGDLYLSFRQSGPAWMNAFLRLRDDTVDPTAMQEAVDDVDSDIPLASVRRLDQVVDEAMRPTRVLAVLLAGFSMFALLLAVLGLYGVVAYAARQHEKDVAIRMALGADRRSVVHELLRQGLLMVVAGLAGGTLGGYLLGGALESQLHGVTPGDPATYASLAGVLAMSALAAMWVPARRAASRDPMRVLRDE
jgi:putative ABC transport system permease protein